MAWQECFSGWTEPFLPESAGDFFAWPLLTDLFPWQHSGVQFKRTWPIAPDRDTLVTRWRQLVSAAPEQRAGLFRESPDRVVSGSYRPILGGDPLTPIQDLPRDAEPPAAVPYAYRSLDRQFCLADNRLCSRPRPPLWRTLGARQLFMTSLLTGLLGAGPAAMVTALIPDLDHFRGSFGAKHVIPLWRDSEGERPNVTAGLLDVVSGGLGIDVVPEEFLAYCSTILSAPGYIGRFAAELEVPGARIPLTQDPELFTRAIALGERLIWLHTYGSRFIPQGFRAGELPQGRARSVQPIGTAAEDYPAAHDFDEATQELRVGAGIFAPVSKSVRAYSVSGLDVIGSWLDYRMREGAGRRSSQLDRIRPRIWPAAFTEELLRLLWIVEHTVDMGPELDETLAAVIAGPLLAASDLPEPSDAERTAPTD